MSAGRAAVVVGTEAVVGSVLVLVCEVEGGEEGLCVIRENSWAL